jgi:DNA modification methylase
MTVRILTGDCRDILPTLPERSVHCCVTSPPYWNLRDYGVDGQIGLEPTLDEYVTTMVNVFREVKRVLRDDGTLWLNLGDCYHGGGYANHKINGQEWFDAADLDKRKSRQRDLIRSNPDLKPKDLVGLPWMVAFALRADGWYLRSDVIWSKPNPMPESVRDRPTSAHEHVFLLTKQPKYFYDADAVRTPIAASSIARLSQDVESQEGSHRANGGAKTNGTMKAVGRLDKQRGHSRRHDGFNDRWDGMSKEEQQANGANLRNVWNIATHAFSEAHFATFPPQLAETCIKAGTSEKGACSSCGAPWIRQIERVTGDLEWAGRSEKNKTIGHSNGGKSLNVGSKADYYENKPRNQTTGWAASCSCDAEIVPCVVLDIFGGSGTTGLVADRLGRDATLIELNPEYIAIGERRIAGDAPMFAAVTVDTPRQLAIEGAA